MVCAMDSMTPDANANSFNSAPSMQREMACGPG
jgi:hypothetical protein